MEVEREENRLDYEETELRLGLPGGGNEKSSNLTIGLKLMNLTTSPSSSSSSSSHDISTNENHAEEKNAKPPAKAQVVGWPPVRSYRKNILAVQKNSSAQKATSPAAALRRCSSKSALMGRPTSEKYQLMP